MSYEQKKLDDVAKPCSDQAILYVFVAGEVVGGSS